MRNTLYWKTLMAVVLLGGVFVTGCKSAPELTQAQALTLIQAKYDQDAPVATHILVNDLGMRQGITGKLWERTKMYPNKYWADFKLTADGKKAVTLPSGGDVMEWRPSGLDDKNYTYMVVTVAANHPKAHDVGEIEDVGASKSANYIEGVNLTGVPDTLQEIAHNPGNKLSTKRIADFTLEGGAWKLHSIR